MTRTEAGSRPPEIGSEFHRMPPEGGTGPVFPETEDSVLVFSGRTAIAALLAMFPRARTALLPSWLCDSMLQPFRAAGIGVRFYDVNWDGGLRIDLPERPDTDILLWCDYFGFRTPMPELTAFAAGGGVILEDITQSLLCEHPAHPQSHVLAASLRKWEPVLCGGWCGSRVGPLPRKPETPPPEAFTAEKALAMDLKADYLAGRGDGDKRAFLERFGRSNEWLAEHWQDLGMDPDSAAFLARADVPAQRAARRRNARRLYERLEGRVDFLFPLESMDCPLFVPIVIPSGRDEIRRELTRRNVYCPIHWPRSGDDCASNLYGTELSLVCDQRYTPEDMDRLADALLAAQDWAGRG